MLLWKDSFSLLSHRAFEVYEQRVFSSEGAFEKGRDFYCLRAKIHKVFDFAALDFDEGFVCEWFWIVCVFYWHVSLVLYHGLFWNRSLYRTYIAPYNLMRKEQILLIIRRRIHTILWVLHNILRHASLLRWLHPVQIRLILDSGPHVLGRGSRLVLLEKGFAAYFVCVGTLTGGGDWGGGVLHMGDV